MPVPLVELVEEGPERDGPDEARADPAPARLEHARLDGARVGAVGHGYHLRVLEAHRLVARQIIAVVADLVDEAVGLRPLGLHLLDVVALLGVGVGGHADAGAAPDHVGRHVEVGAPHRVEGHRQVVLARDDEVEPLVAVGDEQVLPHVGDDLVGEDGDGRPEALGQVEGVDGEPEGLLDRRGREHDGLEVAAVGAVAGHVELPLARRSRDSADGPHPHGVDDHERDLVGHRPAVGVVHERVAGSRGRRHRLEAAQARARAGVHAGQLVLALHVVAAHLREALGHVLGDVGGRGDGVAGEDAAAGGDGAFGQRVGPRLEQAPARGRAPGPVGPRCDQGFLDGQVQRRHQWAPPTVASSGLSDTSMQKSGQIW